jgi:hypothetical protein
VIRTGASGRIDLRLHKNVVGPGSGEPDLLQS